MLDATALQPPLTTSLQKEVLRTLLYYDIWQYPLTGEEVHAFLPVESLTEAQTRLHLNQLVNIGVVQEFQGYFFVPGRSPAVVSRRLEMERHAQRLWRIARISTHIIKRFPFVRAIFVSGDLSKNATSHASDVDFFILTAPNRLWITRTLLALFKKVVLLNSKKYFCLNSFASTDDLMEVEHSIYTATEVAHLKALYNTHLFSAYMKANQWIKEFFPNLDARHLPPLRANNRTSLAQRLFEWLLNLLPAADLDRGLEQRWNRMWALRYPDLEEFTREKVFRCTRSRSCAYVGNFQERILEEYATRLRLHGITA